LGGHLSSIFIHILGMQSRKAVEDTQAFRNHAATLAWKFIEDTLEIASRKRDQLFAPTKSSLTMREQSGFSALAT